MDNNAEYDVSEGALTAYQLIYQKNFKNEVLTFTDQKRPSIYDRFILNWKQVASGRFSGETDFNFKVGFAHSRGTLYHKLLDNSHLPNDDKNFYKKRLSECQKLTHSIVNVSLMPMSGNLQSTKANIGNDRIDVFIRMLDHYYRNNENVLMNYTSYENMPFLKEYLDIFNNIYQYCDVIYHIDRSLVDELIESGKKAIDTPERVIDFMSLAYRFWHQKLENLKRIIASSKKEELLNFNLLLRDIKEASDILDNW
jgi:hypothetical protein